LCAPPGLPPGLEPDLDAASFAANVAAATSNPSSLLEAVEEKLKELVPDAPHQSMVEAMKDTLLLELETKVKERSDDLWSKGRQVVGQMQRGNKEFVQKLTADLDNRRLKRQLLEKENAQLKQTLQGMAARLTLLGQGYLPPKDLSMPPADSSIAPGLLPATPSPGAVTDTSPLPIAGTGGCESPKLLPSVPAFPFPSPGGPPAAPLSLAEALGQLTPPTRQPLSLASSLHAPQTPVMPSPFTTNGQAGLDLV